MSLNKFVKDMAIVSKLDDEPNDVGGMTAAELKATFDEGGVALKDYINNTLVPYLEAVGVENAVLLSGSAGFKYVKLNADKILETSLDGINWTKTGSSGHAIVDGAGVVYPQRSRLKFEDGIVSDNGTETIIKGLKGDKGDRGPAGPAGSGAGDMTEAVYDPQGKAQDIFKYVDDAVSNVSASGVDEKISDHNSSSTAHSDIRAMIAAKSPMYSYGTSNMSAGETPLDDGKLYFVYE